MGDGGGGKNCFPPFYASLLAYVISFENGLNDPANPKASIFMDDNGRSTLGIHLEMYRKFTSSLLEIKKNVLGCTESYGIKHVSLCFVHVGLISVIFSIY